MTDHVSIQSNHVATTAFNNDFTPFRAEDQTQQLLHDQPRLPSPVSPHETPVRRRSARPPNIGQDASVSPAPLGLERHVAVTFPQRPLANESSPPSPIFSPEALVRRRSVGPPNATQGETIELAQFRPESNAATQKSSKIARHIHWLSPSLMTGAFIAGIFLAIGHHLYYQSLNGQVVGDFQRQQWALRFGNVFAFLVKTFLTTAVSIACIQWLWKTLQRKYITIEGIDAAFAVQKNMLSFLNWEILSEIKVGTLIALVVRSIPLIVLITPATLLVETSYQEITTSENVATLDISTFLQYPPYKNNASAMQFIEPFAQIIYLNESVFQLERSSSRFARLISASAASGDIFSIIKPFQGTNMTYQADFFLPAIKCETSSSAVALKTAVAAVNSSVQAVRSLSSVNLPEVDTNNLDMIRLGMNSLEYHDMSGDYTPLRIGYFAIIPDEDDFASTQPVDSPDTVDTLTNQLWIAIADRGTDNNTIPRFLTCKLWNASLSLNVSFHGDVQSLRPENYTFVNEVQPMIAYPGILGINLSPGQVVNLADVAYTAFFFEIGNQLTGLVMEYDGLVLNKANIQDTTLSGASEFATMMRNFSESESRNISQFSPSLNKSLSALIEELSLNFSLNVLTDSVLGALAYRSNGVSYDFNVSSIIGTTQNPDLFRRQNLGAQPLDPQIAKTKLRFGTVIPLLNESSARQPVRRAAFGLEGTVSELEKSGAE